MESNSKKGKIVISLIIAIAVIGAIIYLFIYFSNKEKEKVFDEAITKIANLTFLEAKYEVLRYKGDTEKFLGLITTRDDRSLIKLIFDIRVFIDLKDEAIKIKKYSDNIVIELPEPQMTVDMNEKETVNYFKVGDTLNFKPEETKKSLLEGLEQRKQYIDPAKQRIISYFEKMVTDLTGKKANIYFK